MPRGSRKSGGPREPNAGSREAFDHRNKTTFNKNKSEGVTGRACQRCGVRGTKLKKTSCSSASWKESEDDVNGKLTMMVCPDCATRRSSIGTEIRGSLRRLEEQRMMEFNKR